MIIHLIIIVNILNSINVPNGKSISELSLILSNPFILLKIILSSRYSRVALKTLITSILFLSITKYLSPEPFIFSTLRNKLLTPKYKGLTLFVVYSSLYNTYPM